MTPAAAGKGVPRSEFDPSMPRPGRWPYLPPTAVGEGERPDAAIVLHIAVVISERWLRTRVLQELATHPEVEVVERGRAEVLVGGEGDGQRAVEDGVPAVLLGEWEPGGLPAAVGPCGFLFTDASADEIVAAARAVAAGLTVLAPGLMVAGPRARRLPRQDEDDRVRLTSRELEVMALMAAGLPNKGIARALGISEHTAKYHVGAILSKLDAQSRAEAVVLAARRGLVAL